MKCKKYRKDKYQGNAFTLVYHSVHKGGERSVQPLGRHLTQADTPWQADTPRQADIPLAGRYPLPYFNALFFKVFSCFVQSGVDCIETD